MDIKQRNFIEWGRIGGRMRARRLLAAKNRKKRPYEPPVKPKKRGRKPIDWSKDQRVMDMKAMYVSNHTLASIGAKHGITRERVRQILKRVGINASSSGRSKSILARRISDSAKKEKLRQEKLLTICSQYLSCSPDVYLGLTGFTFAGFSTTRGSSPAARFCQQKRFAEMRGIEWKLTFPEWWEIWEKSGKYHLRGKGQGAYVMARRQDFGSYEKENVFICSSIQNNSDRKEKKSNLPIGVTFRSFGKYVAKKMIDGKNYHVGTFSTPEEAHQAYLKFNGKRK